MKNIFLLFFLISNQALSEVTHDEDIWKEFENLKVFYNYESYIPRKEEIRLLQEGKLRKIDNSFECNNECHKNYKALAQKMNLKNKDIQKTSLPTNYYPDLWGKEVDDIFVDDLYESPDLKNVIGQVITTKPFTFRINDQFYTNETWLEDFKDYYEDENGFLLKAYSFPMVRIDKKVGDSRVNKQAIWIPQLKRFVYISGNSEIFNFSLGSSIGSYFYDVKEGLCPESRILYTILDSVVLYDEKGNKKTKKDLEGMILTNIYKKGKEYIVHFLDTRGKAVKSNLIDGVRLWPGDLLTWYGYDKFVTYTIPEKEILDNEGKITIHSFVNFTYEGRTQFVCPSKIEEPYYSKLRNGEMKFSDLPKDMLEPNYEVFNIFYTCWGNSPVCEEGRKTVNRIHSDN